MLPIDPADDLCSAILDIVGTTPGISVGELQKKLQQRKKSVTLQHVYRLVSRLIESKVVLKNKRSLSLNLLWLSFIELFSQAAREKLLQGHDLPVLDTLKEGARVTLQARSLDEVQAMWHHLLIHINRLVPSTEKAVLHKYYSHAFWLIRPDADVAFYERVAKHIRCYWLIGSESYLDDHARKDYKNIFTIALTDRPTFPAEGYLLNVRGDYVVECVFPKAIADNFALLFRSVESAKDWNAEMFESLFHIRGAFSVTVWRSKKRADELRGKIEHLIPKNLL